MGHRIYSLDFQAPKVGRDQSTTVEMDASVTDMPLGVAGIIIITCGAHVGIMGITEDVMVGAALSTCFVTTTRKAASLHMRLMSNMWQKRLPNRSKKKLKPQRNSALVPSAFRIQFQMKHGL